MWMLECLLYLKVSFKSLPDVTQPALWSDSLGFQPVSC